LIAACALCQRRKLPTDDARTVALEQPDNLRWRILRRGADEASIREDETIRADLP